MPSFRSHTVVLGFGCLLILAGCMSPSEGSNQNNQVTTGGSGGGGAGGAGAAGGSGGVGGASGSGGSAGVAGAMGGMGGAASGGVGGSGSGGAGAGGTTAAGSGGNNDSAIDIGNYFKSGAWMGYVWTSASGEGSTITPMDFELQTTGMPRCVSGSVGMAADFSSVAMLGFNLNEPSGGMGTTIAPTKAGVTINVTNRAMSVLRLVVQSAATGGTQWCTNITGTGGFISWDALRTECWGSTGMKYNREPIVSAMVLVPGKDTMPVAFDFCVDALAEADGPMMMGTGGMGGMGTGGMGTGGMGTGGMDAADAGL
jgi:hypothetical protein